MSSPIFIDTASLRSSLSHATLIRHLDVTLPAAASIVNSPHRTSHQTSATSSLLLMPSWSPAYIGVKLVTHHPENSERNLPGIHGSYVLFEAGTGRTVAVMDGTELTLYRTACVSGLASMYLSREESEVLLMVGAGALAPHLIRAHIAARPSINKVKIWNRNIAKASALADEFLNNPEFNPISFTASEHLDDDVALADIITSATNSETPLVSGSRLKPGAHLDLVGSFKESMRECDDEALRKGRVYVDNEVAVVEAGELIGAFKRGVLRAEDVAGTLAEVVKGEKMGRRSEEEITVFKSVGSAVVDLLSAQLVYETFLKNQELQK